MTPDITLDSGRIVGVKRFYCQPTYLEVHEGVPSRGMNDRMIRLARSQATHLGDGARVYIVRPTIDQSDPDYPMLPRLRCAAWLRSDSIAGKPLNHSELTVVWFTNANIGTPITTMIQDGIHAIAWDELAQEFDIDDF